MSIYPLTGPPIVVVVVLLVVVLLVVVVVEAVVEVVEPVLVVEEPVVEPSLETIPGYEEEARLQYTGGLTEESGEESLAE